MRRLLQIGQARAGTGMVAATSKKRIFPSSWGRRVSVTDEINTATLTITTQNGVITSIEGTFVHEVSSCGRKLRWFKYRLALAIMAFSDHEEIPPFTRETTLSEVFEASYDRQFGFEALEDYDSIVLELLRGANAIDKFQYDASSTKTHDILVNMDNLFKHSQEHHKLAEESFKRALALLPGNDHWKTDIQELVEGIPWTGP